MKLMLQLQPERKYAEYLEDWLKTWMQPKYENKNHKEKRMNDFSNVTFNDKCRTQLDGIDDWSRSNYGIIDQNDCKYYNWQMK